ncbi:predicted protein [Lichtheimia corymbifera JMRC:FSU:9682]|uniref:Uncharacterized protein n=1 Tax=Lichtheimia corymbifera JMRC:FSU:9682 TaxID=1263082 RepID=A0A068RV85_9FUNG|nr:predicted protein [Lichtheimia corymbifera JMRC:FSU:9682]
MYMEKVFGQPAQLGHHHLLGSTPSLYQVASFWQNFLERVQGSGADGSMTMGSWKSMVIVLRLALSPEDFFS